MHRSDPELVKACLRGNEKAWHSLVDRYGRLVYSIANRYRLDDTDADDVFQNVFVILYRRLESLVDQTKLSAWLITTTHRECWRVGKTSGRTEGLDERIHNVDAPEADDLTRWEEIHLVRLALERLGGRCEELLLALFADTKADYQAIGDRLGYVSNQHANVMTIIDPDPNADGDGADAAVAGTIVLSNGSSGAGATDGTGGQGIKPLPMTHDGWIQKAVALVGTGALSSEVEGWIADLTGFQRDPVDEHPIRVFGDLDEDGHVSFGDLLLLLSAWGPCPGCGADLDCDNEVDFFDLLALISAWG